MCLYQVTQKLKTDVENGFVHTVVVETSPDIQNKNQK